MSYIVLANIILCAVLFGLRIIKICLFAKIYTLPCQQSGIATVMMHFSCMIIYTGEINSEDHNPDGDRETYFLLWKVLD